ELLDAVVSCGELVLRRNLPGKPSDALLDVLIFDAGRTVLVKHAGRRVICALVAIGREEPEPVFDNRTAHGVVEILDVDDAVDAGFYAKRIETVNQVLG